MVYKSRRVKKATRRIMDAILNHLPTEEVDLTSLEKQIEEIIIDSVRDQMRNADL